VSGGRAGGRRAGCDARLARARDRRELETRKTRLTFGVFFDDQRVMRPAALGKGIAAPPLAREKSNFLSLQRRRSPVEKMAKLSAEKRCWFETHMGIFAMDTSLIGKSTRARISPERSRQFKGEISFLKP
jgi:hypothetical protein